MDITLAKEFIYKSRKDNTIYICKNLQRLLEISCNHIWDIYGVVDTPQGEKLFELDFAYSGEPIIMRVFLHKDSFFMFYDGMKIIDIN